MGDDFGSAEHMKQALTDMKDLHTAHALHDDIISGEGEHAKTLEHAFNQGAANHYGNSISDDGKITQDGKPHHDSKTAVYDGEHSHDVHALTHSSPFEKEQLKKYKQAKSEGDKNGMAKAWSAITGPGKLQLDEPTPFGPYLGCEQTMSTITRREASERLKNICPLVNNGISAPDPRRPDDLIKMVRWHMKLF